MASLSTLNPVLVEPAVRAALAEDLGRAGDITTDALIPADATAEAAFVARGEGRLAGLALARAAFVLLDPRIAFEARMQDGDVLVPGAVAAVVRGPGRGILTGERVALNFLGRPLGHCQLDGALCGARRAHQGPHLLHPQDDAGPSRP